MCAIFGFISRNGSSPNLNTLGRIIRGNVQRGPHAFGFSWIDSAGRLRSYKQTGRLTDQMGLLAMARDARALVGHLRWATHGQPEDNINNHPHPADGGWIVHNGVVANYQRLLNRNGIHPSSDCDSEVIAQLIECGDGTIRRRCAQAVEATDGNLTMLGLWARPATMIVARRGNPLHVASAGEGLYLASLSDGLPSGARAMKDASLSQFTFRGGRIITQTRTLKASTGKRGGEVDRGTLFYCGG